MRPMPACHMCMPTHLRMPVVQLVAPSHSKFHTNNNWRIIQNAGKTATLEICVCLDLLVWDVVDRLRPDRPLPVCIAINDD